MRGPVGIVVPPSGAEVPNGGPGPLVLGIKVCPGPRGAFFGAEEVDDLISGALGRTVIDREAAGAREAEEATQE